MKAIKGKSAKAATPISSHPLFPAIVALWFAALFGFGSLVLPTILIERAVDAVGLPSLIGATAPPLGFTAKLLIAAMAAAIGAVLGFLIARKVAGSTKPEKQRQRGLSKAESKKRPISAAEELGSETLDTPVQSGTEQHGGRRRGLAMNEEENAPSEFLQQVPLPNAGQEDFENPVPSMEHPVADFENATPGFQQEETISFTQPESREQAVPTETAPVHLGQQQGVHVQDDVQVRPLALHADLNHEAVAKQVFQPQAPASQVASPRVPAEEAPAGQFGNQTFQAPASMDQYEADVQQGMPRLKIEPDPEPMPENDFGFQPLQQTSEQAAPPVNPQLEARLSGLSQEAEKEIPPTSVLENSLRAAKEETIAEQSSSSSEDAPLSFSPPSMANKSEAPEPLELEQLAKQEPSIEAGNNHDVNAPPARLFAMPKGFEDAEPLGAEPAPLTQFDPLAELASQNAHKEEAEKFMQQSPLQELQNDIEQAVANEAVAPQVTEQVEDEPVSSPDVAEEAEEFEEGLPIMTDPISGKPLNALGTVELIERLAKSVRLRATGGAASSAIAQTLAEEPVAEDTSQVDQADPAPATSKQPVTAATDAAIETPNVETGAPSAAPSQRFDQPAAFAPPASLGMAAKQNAEDDFVPSALKPLDLDADDELEDDSQNLSLPLGKSPLQPSAAAAPFAAPAEPKAAEPSAAEENQTAHDNAFPPLPQAFAESEQTKQDAPAEFAASDEEEQPFGSLLELRNQLAQPQQFIRIEDEELDEESAEPAVVFPGQGGQPTPEASNGMAPAPQPFTDDALGLEAHAQPLEPMQAAPATGERQPQQSFAPQGFTHRPQTNDAAQMQSGSAASQQQTPAPKDPAETERALRSALATLQRMSGAA